MKEKKIRKKKTKLKKEENFKKVKEKKIRKKKAKLNKIERKK